MSILFPNLYYTACGIRHALIQNVLSEGSSLDVFLVDDGMEDQNTTISGPSSACQ